MKTKSAFIFCFLIGCAGYSQEGETLFKQSLSYLKQQNFKEASKLAGEALQKNPSLIDKFNAHDEVAEMIFMEAIRFKNDEQYLWALYYMDSSFAMSPGLLKRTTQRYSARAGIKMKLGRNQDAIDDLTEAISVTDKYYDLFYFERGILLMSLNKPLAAIEDFDKAFKYRPTKWRILYTKAQTLISLNRLEEALDTLNDLLEIEDNQAEPIITRGWLYFRMGDMVRACEDLQKAKAWGFDEFDNWIELNCN